MGTKLSYYPVYIIEINKTVLIKAFSMAHALELAEKLKFNENVAD